MTPERKRGHNIVLMDVTKSGDDKLYHIVADESEGIRNEKDIREFMTRTGAEGTLYPFRPLKPVTRSMEKVAKFK